MSNSQYRTSCNNWNEKKQHRDLSKERINQWTRDKIIIMLPSYKVIASCQTANIVPAAIIEMKRNNLEI